MTGDQLDPGLRQSLEQLFACDFGDVRIHRGPDAAKSAASLGAAAYTAGSHIVFADGRYQPETASGRMLIAHELVHVLQQRACPPEHRLRVGGPWHLEEEAERIAARVVAGHPAGAWSPAPVPGLLQMHQDVPCPGPPEWQPINARDDDIADAANLTIEAAYAARFGRSGVIFGSEYKRYTGEYLISEIGYSDRGLAFARELLKDLRGTEAQNAPDIVDFKRRCFYEIKTDLKARQEPQKVQDQLLDLYRKTRAIAKANFGTSSEPQGNWDPANATWYPPHVLKVPGDPNLMVCTCATDYTRWTRGLILYDVREAVARRRRPEARVLADANGVDVVDVADEARPILPMLDRDIRVQARYFDRKLPYYVILFSPKFYNSMFQQTMNRKWDMLRVHAPFLDVKNPIGFNHLVIGGVVLLAAGVILVWAAAAGLIAAAALTGEMIAVAGAGAGTSAAGAGGAEVVSLAAYRALKAAPAAINLAKAAGVLLVLGAARRAAADSMDVSDLEVAARVVPLTDFRIQGGNARPEGRWNNPDGPYYHDPGTIKTQFQPRSKVLFEGKPYIVGGMVWPHE